MGACNDDIAHCVHGEMHGFGSLLDQGDVGKIKFLQDREESGEGDRDRGVDASHDRLRADPEAPTSRGRGDNCVCCDSVCCD